MGIFNRKKKEEKFEKVVPQISDEYPIEEADDEETAGDQVDDGEEEYEEGIEEAEEPEEEGEYYEAEVPVKRPRRKTLKQRTQERRRAPREEPRKEKVVQVPIFLSQKEVSEMTWRTHEMVSAIYSHLQKDK